MQVCQWEKASVENVCRWHFNDVNVNIRNEIGSFSSDEASGKVRTDEQLGAHALIVTNFHLLEEALRRPQTLENRESCGSEPCMDVYSFLTRALSRQREKREPNPFESEAGVSNIWISFDAASRWHKRTKRFCCTRESLQEQTMVMLANAFGECLEKSFFVKTK